MSRRLLIALIATVACLAAAPTALADGLGASPSGAVDVVRYTVGPGGTTVRHDILIDTGAAADPQQAADQVVANAQQTGPTCQSTPGQSEVVAQYCLNSWSWKAADIPVHVRYNPAAPAGLTVPSALDPIQNAIAEWSSVTPNFSFVYDGTTTAQPTACDPTDAIDGINTVAWVDGIGSNKAILAQTCTIQNPDGSLAEFDMEINAQMKFSANPGGPPVGYYDLYSNILHEFGHAAGLAHSQYASAVMFESLLPSIEKRTLTLDDIDAIKAKYGFPMQQLPLRWVIGGLVHD